MKFLRKLSHAGFLVLALLAACVTTCAANRRNSEGQLSNWENLKSLARGQEIRVEMNNGKSYQCKFESFSDDGITLQQAAGEQTLARKDILRVSRGSPSHRTRNILIGAAVGAGIGLAAGLEADHVIWNKIGVRRAWAPIGTIGVGLAGAGIGAVIPAGGGWHVIYRSPEWRHLIYRNQ